MPSTGDAGLIDKEGAEGYLFSNIIEETFEFVAAEESKPLSDDDAVLEEIYKKQHSLQEFLAPTNFKSYDELKTKLYRVLALGEESSHVASAPQPQPEAVAPSIPTTSADEDVPLSSDSDDDEKNIGGTVQTRKFDGNHIIDFLYDIGRTISVFFSAISLHHLANCIGCNSTKLK